MNLRLRMIAAGEPYAPRIGSPCRAMAAPPAMRNGRCYFDGQILPSRLYRREALTPGDAIHGPAMITEYTSATVLPPGCRAQVDGFGNLVIIDRRGGAHDFAAS